MSALRRTAWTIGAPMRAIMIGGIRLYRLTLSGWLGGQCRYYPTCSHYAEEAIRQHGALRGSAMASWRIMRCNPFGAGGLDPVPPRRGRDPRPRAQEYDGILQRATSPVAQADPRMRPGPGGEAPA